MFASKSERKVHYSIRKFSVGVASVVVASLFLGGVVHAEGVRSGDTPKVTSSGQDISKKYADEVKSHLEKILSEIQLDKRKHTQNLAFNKKLSRIQTEYFYLKKKLKAELTSKTKEELTSKTEELTSKTKKELDAAFEQFKKDTLSTEPEKKVAEAQKKVAEAKKKAEDQKEEDRRNYPTNTYKTLELEIAEFDVKVKEAELELLKEKAKESRDEEKIKQAEAEVESKQAEATRLENIKTDRKKAEEEAKRKADAKLKEAVEKNAATSEQGKPKRRVKRGALGEQATPDKKDYFEKDFRPAFNKNQQMVAIQESLNKLDDETKTVPDGAKLTGEAGNAYNEVRDYAIKVVSENKKLLSQTAVTMDELAMQLTKLNDAMSKLKEAKAKLVPEVKPQPENPEHQKPTTPAPDTKPIPQPEGKKPSVPDINQEKEKAKLAVATYMSKILDDIQKHHLQKEKHRQIVALIKELDEFKKQALSEIDNVNTKVEIENTVHKIFADMDAVVTKFKKGLTQDTPKEPDNKKPSA
ncbi:TPA: RICH domain-containing protein, partial [Streptococcus pneumoniae]|nr:RICH domain-containing protein [Streptococcus pneumoniae]